EMDGLALAAQIRRYPDCERLPLVMLTSIGRQEINPPAMEMDFAAFLNKPIKQSQLYNVLINIFGEQRTEFKGQRTSGPFLQTIPVLAENLPLRILLADDHLVNQKVALQILQRMGYRADVAGNGIEVLEALRRQPYDVVLMDVQMPEMDGLETTRHIREQFSADLTLENPTGESEVSATDEQSKNRKSKIENPKLTEEESNNRKSKIENRKSTRPWIVAMTANAMQGDREKCLEAGMDDYITKPVRREELAIALSKCSPLIRDELDAVTEEKNQDISDQVDSDAAGSSSVQPGADSPIDFHILQNLRELDDDEDPDFLGELIKIYLVDAPQHLETIKEAIFLGDADSLKLASHTLKSSSANLGAVSFSAVCKEVVYFGRL
ncbi:response regulator, partial [Microcoleus sp. HI-ES]|nr:response regulator [Microcoleus sp. HI-ES]